MSNDFWIKDLEKTHIGVSHSILDKLIADATTGFVAVGGRIGGASAKELRAHCQALLRTGIVNVVIDMGGVEFIASSGAGTLVVLSEGFQGKGGGLQILRASESVKRVVDLLNIGRFIALVESEDEALANVPAYS